MLSPTQATWVGIRACACAAPDASDATTNKAVPIAIRTFSGAEVFIALLCPDRPDPINDQDDRPAPYSHASSSREPSEGSRTLPRRERASKARPYSHAS